MPANWLCSGVFLLPRDLPALHSLTTGHCSFAPRLTRHASGVTRARTLPRWLLLSTDRSGSREVLLPPRPLRTGRESCPSSSSSIHKRPLQDAAASPKRPSRYAPGADGPYARPSSSQWSASRAYVREPHQQAFLPPPYLLVSLRRLAKVLS